MKIKLLLTLSLMGASTVPLYGDIAAEFVNLPLAHKEYYQYIGNVYKGLLTVYQQDAQALSTWLYHNGKNELTAASQYARQHPHELCNELRLITLACCSYITDAYKKNNTIYAETLDNNTLDDVTAYRRYVERQKELGDDTKEKLKAINVAVIPFFARYIELFSPYFQEYSELALNGLVKDASQETPEFIALNVRPAFIKIKSLSDIFITQLINDQRLMPLMNAWIDALEQILSDEEFYKAFENNNLGNYTSQALDEFRRINNELLAIMYEFGTTLNQSALV